jgi:hypothetical protein
MTVQSIPGTTVGIEENIIPTIGTGITGEITDGMIGVLVVLIKHLNKMTK